MSTETKGYSFADDVTSLPHSPMPMQVPMHGWRLLAPFNYKRCDDQPQSSDELVKTLCPDPGSFAAHIPRMADAKLHVNLGKLIFRNAFGNIKTNSRQHTAHIACMRENIFATVRSRNAGRAKHTG